MLVAQELNSSGLQRHHCAHEHSSVIWSAMSSPCWSLPHLLSSSPPQHEAPPGQHDLLQDDTAPLPEPIQSTSRAKEPLSHVNYESGGNPRTNTPTLLISDIYQTSEYRQYCCVGNTAQRCTLELFQDSDFSRDLEDSKSTSGGLLSIFGSHKFVPPSWMCKKQTTVSHISTEAEIISLDASLRMDGIPALDLWDFVIEVFHSVPNRTDGPKRELRGKP